MYRLAIYGEPVDEGALTQIYRCLKHPMAEAGVLCADHHKGYSMPIGGVIAYKDAVSPTGVGFDIGCGNRASRLDIPANEVRSNIKTIMNDVFSSIEFGIGRSNSTSVDDPLFESAAWGLDAVHDLRPMASRQLGTVGSGNHYVDIMIDELDRVWIGVHFGSRGLGHKIATYFLQQGGAKDSMDADATVFGTDTEIGQDYLRCMELAGAYAYAGRNWVVEEVARMLGANILETVHNHHNYAWKEVHSGIEYYVVRKGATPAFPGQKGFVGGSMGDNAVIIEGVESPKSIESFYSTVHGAGRVMSRTKAAGKMNYKTKKRESNGLISPQMMHEWLAKKGVELRGGGCDEAPQAYKRLPDVLEAHEGTIKILHTLKPIGVAMAGEDIFDPYKD
jgi:tRNA-splicing ligase RtcB